MGKFGGKGKGGGLQHASNHSSVSGLDQLNMSDKDINVSTAIELIVFQRINYKTIYIFLIFEICDLFLGRVGEDAADIKTSAGDLVIVGNKCILAIGSNWTK